MRWLHFTVVSQSSSVLSLYFRSQPNHSLAQTHYRGSQIPCLVECSAHVSYMCINPICRCSIPVFEGLFPKPHNTTPSVLFCHEYQLQSGGIISSGPVQSASIPPKILFSECTAVQQTGNARSDWHISSGPFNWNFVVSKFCCTEYFSRFYGA